MAKHAASLRIKKVARKEKKAFNEKDIKYWKARVRKECHKYIRLRDAELPCISCGITTGQFHAGHYRPATNSITRYNVDNIHKQCAQCNEKKSGNLIPYRINLIDKVGIDKVEWLESANGVQRWTIDELKRELSKFKTLNRELI